MLMEMARRFLALPREAAIFFLIVAALSVAALVWTGLRLVQEDRQLEARQLQERREAAADRAVVALQHALSAEERSLDALPATDAAPAATDAVLIRADTSEMRVWPERTLLFYPVAPLGRVAPAEPFAAAERAEFVLQDYRRAIRELRSLTRSGDLAVRAGAELRLARNLKKAGDVEGALEAYARTAATLGDDVSVSGAPAGLAARRARCALLAEAGRWDELRMEAQELEHGLQGGRWRLDRTSFFYYWGQSAQWLGQQSAPEPERQALAEAVIWIWQNRQAIADVERGSSGRRSLSILGTPITVLWRFAADELSAMVAGPRYQRSQWFDRVAAAPELAGVRLTVTDPEQVPVYGSRPDDAAPTAARLAATTGLPWDVVVASAEGQADLDLFATRRRLMMTGVGMLALLIVTVSFVVGRAVSRELAAARLQSDFVSAVSHEFRTPLTSMRQFTEMLLESEALPPEKRRAFYGVQARATRRLSRLVESLLDFGRMEAGARPYRLEPLDAGALVRATVEEFRQEIGATDVALECNAPEAGPFVRADREALAQALWNLLDNAVKYSGERPEVRVEVREGDPVAITVRDRGAGIPRSEQRRIFKKFVRGSNAKAQSVKGTGIGLAMVKHIVGAHGGKVAVASEPGEGSAFTVLLPRGA